MRQVAPELARFPIAVVGGAVAKPQEDGQRQPISENGTGVSVTLKWYTKPCVRVTTRATAVQVASSQAMWGSTEPRRM
jgi:hypothetical protein